ncbi:hypothetical protein Kkor_1357 [Kangiella koreensis DSM 16069]|uniref:Uncharacterized protein n=1 Tax=Kangiella koreensis (strain DSM 16069 / JCM 12317 / KCTC 12182 / SW-125) TaxID=523791 RepID=C7RBX8_KANKD|nr:hypothetical protein Kkor_1357 [Kangiella koreensis DSM 16069]
MTPKQEKKAVLYRMVTDKQVCPYELLTDGLYINANPSYKSFKTQSQKIPRSLWLFLSTISAKVMSINSVKSLAKG